MTVENFDGLLSHVLNDEGGWANHPADPGGATMKGVTQRVYTAWRKAQGLPDQSVRYISNSELKAIYRQNYWNVVRGDDLPSGLDYPTFDGGVNSGPPRGTKWLQGALGVKADGVVGIATLQAARSAPDKAAVARKACALRRSFLRGLKTFSTFGKGWMRRVAGVEAHSVALALAAAGLSGAALANKLEEYGARNEAKSKTEAGKATGAGSGAAGAGAVTTQPDVTGLDTTGLVALGIATVVLVVVALVLWRNARAEHEVAKAYAAKAREIAAA
jgi:Putative secretion activating protein